MSNDIEITVDDGYGTNKVSVFKCNGHKIIINHYGLSSCSFVGNSLKVRTHSPRVNSYLSADDSFAIGFFIGLVTGISSIAIAYTRTK